MLSKYVYELKLKNGNTLLYNAINKAMVEIGEDIEEIDQESKNYLVKDHFLVYDEDEDKCLLNEYLLEMKYSQNILSFTIHTNYNCNLMCTYCYQNSIKNNLQMNQQTVDKTLRFINYLCETRQPLILDIGIIGGEPLLNYDRIKYILLKLRKLKCRFKRISIITNGIFLTLDRYEELVKLDVDFFQITLDGTKEIHDTKRMKGGKGSFDLIFKNLKEICYKYRENKIVINYNLDIDTCKGVESFFEYLQKANINCKVIFSEIFDGKEHLTGKEIDSSSIIWFDAHKTAINYGQRYDPFYRMPYLTCGIKKNNSFMVNPEGKLYKCISGMEDTNYLLGNIEEFQTHIFSINMSKFIEEDYREECQGCKYFPVCGGGCVYRNRAKEYKCNQKTIELNDLQIIKYQYEIENQIY